MRTCTKCNVPKPDKEFWLDNRRANKKKSRCIDCCRVANRARFQANKDAILKDGRRRYHLNPGRPRQNHLVRKYGVTLERYAEMLREQDGKCAICGALEAEQRHGVFNVDHDHATGAVRGLLCWGCNHILGTVKDNAETLLSAVSYLSHKRPKPSSAHGGSADRNG